MKLPNVHLALVESEKITGYLLNATHLWREQGTFLGLVWYYDRNSGHF